MPGQFAETVTLAINRWLQSLAAGFGSANRLFLILAMGAAFYLGRRLAARLGEKLGIGTKPLLAGVVLVCSLIGISSGWGETRRAGTPTPLVGKSRAFQERQRLIDRRRAMSNARR